MPKDKTDNFLKAIKKYAKEQKTAMHGEVKQLKSERLKEAEEEAKRESQRRIKENLREARSRKTAEFAKKVREGRSELFLQRAAMVDEIFELAARKLVAYTASAEYAAELKDGAKAIAELFEDSGVPVEEAEEQEYDLTEVTEENLAVLETLSEEDMNDFPALELSLELSD